MKRNVLNKVFAVAIVAVGVALAAPTLEARGNSGPTIADIVVSNPDIDNDGQGDFDILLDAVLLADPSILNRLSSGGQNTVFAPTDDAFEAAFEELEMLDINPGDVLADTELLTLILNYHISPGYRDSGTVLGAERIRMRDGGFLFQENGLLIDNLGRDAGFEATDIEACNGIVHVIDTVVLPGLP